jgi:hypothetical protein
MQTGFPTMNMLFTLLFCDWGRHIKLSFLFSGDTVFFEVNITLKPHLEAKNQLYVI